MVNARFEIRHRCGHVTYVKVDFSKYMDCEPFLRIGKMMEDYGEALKLVEMQSPGVGVFLIFENKYKCL